MSNLYPTREELNERKWNELSEETREKLKKQHSRQKVTQTQNLWNGMSFDSLLEQATEFAKEWDADLKDVTLEHSWYEDYGSPTSEIHFEVQGLETDTQYHSRLWEIHEREQWQNKREREEFERLKAKFG